jgi:hypothetical protein
MNILFSMFENLQTQLNCCNDDHDYNDDHDKGNHDNDDYNNDSDNSNNANEFSKLK